jgi:hypothetical protein
VLTTTYAKGGKALFIGSVSNLFSSGCSLQFKANPKVKWKRTARILTRKKDQHKQNGDIILPGDGGRLNKRNDFFEPTILRL